MTARSRHGLSLRKQSTNHRVIPSKVGFLSVLRKQPLPYSTLPALQLKLAFVIERIDDRPELFRIQFDFHYSGPAKRNKSSQCAAIKLFDPLPAMALSSPKSTCGSIRQKRLPPISANRGLNR
jgi:hypothetical protein